MAYTKPEYCTNQLQTNQRKSVPVQVPFWRHSQVGYLVCLPLVGLALLGSLLEQQLGLHAYFSSAPLLLAVVLISLLWGSGPALLAILVSILVLDYMYVPPTGSFDLHTWDGLLQVLPFILSGALIAIITAQRETARRRALLADPSLYQGRNIELKVPSLPIMVQMDREDLKQVMVNVVRHALKHSLLDGTVQVSLSQDKEHIHIEVRYAEAKQTQVHEQYKVESRHIDLHPASRDDSSLWFVISQTIVEWYVFLLQSTWDPLEFLPGVIFLQQD